MPRIPTYLAAADYRRARGDLSTAGAPGRMLAQFGKAAGELAETIGVQAQKVELAKKAGQAQAEAERARGTADAMAALHQSIADFDADTDPASLMDRYRMRADEIGQPIFEQIRDPQARAQAETDYKTFADVQGTLLERDALKSFTAKGRQDLAGHLDLYADLAAGARHPLEHGDAVDLAVREIRGKAATGFITAAEAESLEQGFHANLAERQASRAIAADPQGALADLKGGEAFAALPADRRARLIEEAGRAVQAQALTQQTEAAAAKRGLLVRLPGHLDTLRDGGAPDDPRFSRDSLIATLGKDEGEARWTQIEDARAFGKTIAAIRWAAPDEIAQKLDAETDPDSPLHQAVARRNAQLSAAPADYVLNNPQIAALHAAVTQATAQPKLAPAMASAYQAAGAPVPAAIPGEDRRAAIKTYANASLAEQERLGVEEKDRRVLPAAEAQDLVAQITTGDAAKADETLRGLAADWGDAWPTVLADLARSGLPAEYIALAAAKTPAARQTIADVLAVQAKESGTLRNKAGNDAKPIDDLIARLHEDGILSSGRVKLAKLVAYHHALFTEPEEAVNHAFADLSVDSHALANGSPMSLDEMDIQNHVTDFELAQMDASQAAADDHQYSEVKRSSDGTPLPPSPTPRPRSFGGPKVASGQKKTTRDIEPKPPAVQPADIAETLRRSRPSRTWRDAIAAIETGGRPYDGYGTSIADVDSRGVDGYALGRYQMRRGVLQDAGMLNEYEEWTGKYGVYSWQDFLNNPQAQEAVLVDWSEKTDRYIRMQHAPRLGKHITGIAGDITVTESGLAVAIHKEGTRATRDYFRWVEAHGWNSRDHQEKMKRLPRKDRDSYLAVETRLRKFQNLPYKTP